MGTAATAKNRVGRRLVMRVVVWLTFVWLAVLAGFFVWSYQSHRDTERQAPELVAAVDGALRSAASQNPGLLNAMVSTNLIQSFDETGATDVFSVVPVVEGAKPFRFSVTPDGAAVIGYRGTSLANEVCVRGVLSPSGAVTTQRWSCSDW